MTIRIKPSLKKIAKKNVSIPQKIISCTIIEQSGISSYGKLHQVSSSIEKNLRKC